MSRLKSIEGYADYLISDSGEVYSNKRNNQIQLKKIINSRGYYYVNLCKNGKYKSVSIHRLVGKAFVNNECNHEVLNHIDGNKLNNHYTNLEWCTIQHNMKEASRLGLLKIKRGAESNLYSGKLNLIIANNIRNDYKSTKYSCRQLAQKYNVSKATIINILHDRIYI